MKNLILPLVLLIGIAGFSQTKSFEELEVKKEVRAERVDVVVEVDSLEELESTFTVEDVKSVFELTSEDKDVSFKLVCNGEVMSNGKKSHMSYKIEGTSSDQEDFLERIDVIRKAAINYYKNKK
ncbi:hypothetical protein [uncultured Winogradskyella sp.]|uniref:hypothetical protein n=1 Tax=uncultured Winogradskyella sp. TaxID=395353 RepID=UPI003518A40D